MNLRVLNKVINFCIFWCPCRKCFLEMTSIAWLTPIIICIWLITFWTCTVFFKSFFFRFIVPMTGCQFNENVINKIFFCSFFIDWMNALYFFKWNLVNKTLIIKFNNFNFPTFFPFIVLLSSVDIVPLMLYCNTETCIIYIVHSQSVWPNTA